MLCFIGKPASQSPTRSAFAMPGKSGINVRSAHGICIGTMERTRKRFVASVSAAPESGRK